MDHIDGLLYEKKKFPKGILKTTKGTLTIYDYEQSFIVNQTWEEYITISNIWWKRFWNRIKGK